MSIYGTSSNATYSTTFTGLDPMLAALEDNFANEITAKNVRDTAFTLWERMDTLDTVIAGVTSGVTFSASSITYTNLEPSTVTVGGIVTGTTFSARTIQQMFDDMFYPYIQPTISVSIGSNISIPGADREFGATTSVILNWTVTPHGEDITLINSIPPILPGQVTIPYPGPFSTAQSNTNNFVSVQNTNSLFTINAQDAVSISYQSSAQVTWYNKRYWGKIDLTSIGNPNLTLNPGSASIVNITSGNILALTGAGVGSGNELSTTLSKTYTGINGSGWYLIFAFPTSFGTPSFSVNGLPNTAFTKVESSMVFTNVYGYNNNYDVWISNTQQGSSLNVIIS